MQFNWGEPGRRPSGATVVNRPLHSLTLVVSEMAIVRQQPQPRNARTSKLRYMNAWIARRYRCKLSNAYIHGGVLENDILSPSSILSRGLSTVDGCSTA